MRNNNHIQYCPKTYTRDQDKARTPEQTIENFYKRIDNFDIKILSEVKRIDNGRLDIPVYFSVCTDRAQAMTGTKKQMGKGASTTVKGFGMYGTGRTFFFFFLQSREKNFIAGDFASLREQGYPVMDSSYLASQ